MLYTTGHRINETYFNQFSGTAPSEVDDRSLSTLRLEVTSPRGSGCGVRQSMYQGNCQLPELFSKDYKQHPISKSTFLFRTIIKDSPCLMDPPEDVSLDDHLHSLTAFFFCFLELLALFLR